MKHVSNREFPCYKTCKIGSFSVMERASLGVSSRERCKLGSFPVVKDVS